MMEPAKKNGSRRRRRRRRGGNGNRPPGAGPIVAGAPITGALAPGAPLVIQEGQPLITPPLPALPGVPPSALEQRCLRQFPRVAHARGKEYFMAGRVSPPTRTGDIFALQVKGNGENYGVWVDFSQAASARSLQARCECPFYAGGGLCKHLWAAVLQIDKSGMAETVPGTGPLRVLHALGRNRRGEQRARGQGNGPTVHLPHGQPRPVSFTANTVVQTPASRLPGPTDWIDRLDLIQGLSVAKTARSFSGNSLAYFVLNASETVATSKLILDLWTRNRTPYGDLGPLRPFRIMGRDFSSLFADTRDQEILSLLGKTGEPQTFAPFGRQSGNLCSRFTVDSILESHLLTSLISAGKLFLSRAPNGSPDDADRPVRMDRGKPWDLELRIDNAVSTHYRLDGFLKRDGEMKGLGEPVCVLRSGFLLFGDHRLGRMSDPRQVAWVSALRGPQEFLFPRDQGDALLTRILTDPSAPKLTWPEGLGWTRSVIEPRPKGVFRPLGNDPTTGRMTLTVSFDYAGREVALSDTEETVVDVAKKSVYSRNLAFEEATLTQALAILQDPQGTGTFAIGEMHRVASELSASGWLVFMENQRLVVADDFGMNVSTSTDWFDLQLEASFGGDSARQADLIAALEAKSGLVRLPDGTLGMLPKEWLERYATFGTFGVKAEDGSLRFSKSQGLMLNAALLEEDRVRADKGFIAFQDKVRKFEGLKTSKSPAGFKGKLRNYQKEGLTWLSFISEFEMGGVLADDMGLGKTIQVLAFLLARKTKRKLPNLVVAPKSLVFNWIDEAERFVPGMKIVRYAGDGRTKFLKDFADADLVVTTYGTVRTDIEKLREHTFDVAIVDEAQAIKNPKSQSAIACKQLKAGLRLALTGTPIENSIGDLFSILEFTSPGLLDLTRENVGEDTQAMLSRMLKPFVLRRTKERVLTELPEKSEQVLYCEMSTEERETYNALREHYRASLAEKIEQGGIGRSKIHVLEALLRLRQAACHVGLINPEKASEPSAKLEVLLSQLQEVIQEGHKALVFSQFTSLLALVKPMLDQAGIAYEYLDGQTDDRKTPVENFQTNPKVPVFLISLKAGGTGLNLTAADYVFILDPWWNPAVEAQAIGRAHRMGQAQKVFAYRMIAKGTVEEKILDLQKTKKDLAESIISEDKDFLKKLSKEDLEMLLG